DRPWYDASVFAQDLVYVPEVLATADDVDRDALVAQLDDYLADVDPRVHDGLPAVDRLAWHHVRRHDWEQLRAVLQFKDTELATSRAVRRFRHWYVDAPGRRDRSLPR